ncbi:MAG TPA: AAA family ATPase, partial [Archangium sp.]|nr:AAA family ATPase [Archangium sp.]
MNLSAGYQLEATLHDGARSTLLRARRLSDNRPVVLKVPKADYLDRRRVLELRREYAIMRALAEEYVVRALEVEEFPDRIVLVLEDFGGVSLKHLLVARCKLGPGEFFDYALKLAKALGEIHRRNIIHKDIKPHNIIVNTSSGVVKLADFANASSIAHEGGAASSSPRLSGTLAYMAPEQTGRMNLGVDYRADYYALGATFYEMLVGARPFTTQEPLELVHAHLAKLPPAPHEVDPTVPLALSQLVMKLLAKSPEDRYQSAQGLMADLLECRRRLDNGLPVSFELGRADRQRLFHLPKRLYDRSAPVAFLLDAYERTATGERALVLVSGRAGVGKTSVIDELHPRILTSRGRFTGGKCEQLIRGTPFAPFAQAMASLVQQLLAERVEVGEWARRIHASLGTNVTVLAEAVPEVQHLLGEQPAPEPLPTTESRHRLHFVLQRFLQLFTEGGRPLVIFLDDLQWADSATLSFLQSLVCSAEVRHLLLIGTYRDQEVSAGHPLSLLMGELEAAAPAQVRQLHLSELGPEDVTAMVGESLRTDLETARPLARMVHAKTGGNPLFVKEFLRFLHVNGLLTFDESSPGWSWELQRIEQHPLPENVVELMVGGLRALPPRVVDT